MQNFGFGRSYRCLWWMWKCKHQLQLLPKPSLSKMSRGKNREKWIENQGNRTASLPVLLFLISTWFYASRMYWTKPHFISPNVVWYIVWICRETLQTFGKKKRFKMGMIAVLHAGDRIWAFIRIFLHCSGGGVDESGTWKNLRSDGKFLFR